VHDPYAEFLTFLDSEDRLQCVEFALSRLDKGELDIITLYNEILTPSLREKYCKDKQREICIWEEHVRTSIIRTIVEACYIHVAKEKTAEIGSLIKGKAMVVCPTEEYHEIGARMVTDFFTLCGYDATFVGANTPPADVVEAIRYIEPRYVALSVTSHYNLVAAKKLVQQIVGMKNQIFEKCRIIVGGHAFHRNREIYRDMGADACLETFQDIKNYVEGDA